MDEIHGFCFYFTMMDDTDKTVDSVGSVDDAMASPQQRPGEDGSLEDILATTSRDIIHAFAASINQNAAREADKTEEFRQGIQGAYMLVDVDCTTQPGMQS